MSDVKKIIVVEDCLQCPKWMKCKPSKALKPKTRFTLICGVGIGKFILKGCPLDDLPIITQQPAQQHEKLLPNTE